MATLTVIGLFEPTEQVSSMADTTRFAVAVPAQGPSQPAEIKGITYANLLAQLQNDIMGGGGTTNIGISHPSSLIGTVSSAIAEGGGGPTVSIVGSEGAGEQVTSVTSSSRIASIVPSAGPGQPPVIRYITFANLLAQIVQAVPSGGGSGGVNITADTEVPGTVPSEVSDGGPAPPTYHRYIAVSADTTFSASEFISGHTGVHNALVVPHFSGVRRYIGIAVPDSTGDINRFTVGGIDVSMAFMRVTGTVDIHGIAYKYWRTINDQADNAAGQVYSFTQV